MAIAALRTDDTRFQGLPDWPYAPRYFDELAGYESLRVHFVDEGPADAKRVFLCLHGEPTWGYLYRHFIPKLSRSYRVVVPDHMGFGKSETPGDKEYSFEQHVESSFQMIVILQNR